MSDDQITTVTDQEKPEDFRYFFVAYTLGFGAGNTILRQRKPKPGDADQGCNFIAMTMHLMDKMNAPVVITSWKETTAQRYTEWIGFLNNTMPKRYSFYEKRETKLGVVEGGGEKTEKKMDGLQIVKPVQTD